MPGQARTRRPDQPKTLGRWRKNLAANCSAYISLKWTWLWLRYQKIIKMNLVNFTGIFVKLGRFYEIFWPVSRPQVFLQGYFWVIRPRNWPPGSSDYWSEGLRDYLRLAPTFWNTLGAGLGLYLCHKWCGPPAHILTTLGSGKQDTNGPCILSPVLGHGFFCKIFFTLYCPPPPPKKT